MVECKEYFGGDDIYSNNDLERFLFFSQAILEILSQLDWQPEIVHCHDWHTSLLVMFANKRPGPRALVFTIHNLAYQGAFDGAFLKKSQLEKHWGNCPSGTPEPLPNFLSQGIFP